MEEGPKKVLMIVLVVVFLAAAGIITWKTRSGGGSALRGSTLIWVKCNNPDCGAEYQITQKEYLELIKGNAIPGIANIPAMTCQKCGEKSAFTAIKCEKCDTVFIRGTVEGPYEDKCPKCGYSKMEERRKGR